MKERIHQIIRGVVECETPHMVFEADALNTSIQAGYTKNFNITIRSENKILMKGVVYSTNPSVVLKQEQFVGTAVRIGFEVNAVLRNEEYDIDGFFNLVTNGGEYQLPYRFHVLRADQSLGKQNITRLEDFTIYVRKYPEEAAKLFASKDFLNFPFMKDITIVGIYESLLAAGDVHRALEEFLVYLHEKSPVCLKMNQSNTTFVGIPDEPTYIRLSLEEWGQVNVKFEVVEGDFLTLEKQIYNTKDFIDGCCNVPFRISKNKIHAGYNYGKIVCKVGYHKLEYNITVRIPSIHQTQYLEDKKVKGKILKLILEYYAKNYEEGIILGSLEGILADCEQRYQNNYEWLGLIHAWVNIQQNREEHAKLSLNKIKDSVIRNKNNDLEAYCFYVYLSALANKNEEQLAYIHRLVVKYYAEGIKSVFFVLLGIISQEPCNGVGFSLNQLEEQFELGCRSPFLYRAAFILLEEAPDFLVPLNSFKIQVLLYGLKSGQCSKNLAYKIVELLKYEKHFSLPVFRILTMVYEKYPESGALIALISLLIRGGKTNKKYFCWYELGVKEDLKLTGLFEYYLYTLPKEWKQSLPENILLYYTYNSDLNDQMKEILYVNILKYHGPGSPLFLSYKSQIEKFAIFYLLNGKITQDMVLLYKTILHPDIIDENLAKVLPDLLFAKRVVVKDKTLYKVIVHYPEITVETYARLKNGEACIPIYSKDAVLVFEDIYGNRYCDIDFKLSPIYENDQLLARCREVHPTHFMLRVLESKRYDYYGISNLEELKEVKLLLDESKLHPLYKKHLLHRIFNYCYSNEGDVGCDDYLLSYPLKNEDAEMKRKVVEILIQREYYESAFEKIKENQIEDIRDSRLLILVTNVIQEKSYLSDPYLLLLSKKLLIAGQYNLVISEYLCMNYNGSICDMLQIYRAAKARHANLCDLPERLLAYMLFAGSYSNIDEVYQSFVVSEYCDELLKTAYLVIKCYLSFMQDIRLNEENAKNILMSLEREETSGRLPAICGIAYLKYLSESSKINERQRRLGTILVNQFTKRGKVFPFYANLSKHFPLPYELNGKTILDIKAKSGEKVIIEYKIGECEGKFANVQMDEIYPGLYMKQFTLFAGDTLNYFIYMEKEEERFYLQKNMKLSANPCYIRKDSFFDLLNSVDNARLEKKYKDAKEILRTMEINNKMVDRLFTNTDFTEKGGGI